MWFLTSTGPVLSNARLYLRPGTAHLLGRTSGRSALENGERVQYIEGRSVSRKHCLIRILPVVPGASATVHTRSTVVIEDGSKMGTWVDGEKVVQAKVEIPKGKADARREIRIKLGNYEHEFVLKWESVTLSLTASLGKPKKAKKNATASQQSQQQVDSLARVRAILEQADVKVVLEYITNETTHAITKKRNTPAALEALAQGKWVVTEGYMHELAAALTKDDEDLSPLERDFDANWPSEANYLVPAGSEPHPRPEDLLKPNPERAEVLHGLTFVFLQATQHELLRSAVNAAGGKALLWEVELGQSKEQDLVKYMKEAAGQKGAGDGFGIGKGVAILVRPTSNEESWTGFLRAVDLELDQRSIEQNEFLDVILTLDAKPLQKRLEEAEDGLYETPARASQAAPPANEKGRRDGQARTSQNQQAVQADVTTASEIRHAERSSVRPSSVANSQVDQAAEGDLLEENPSPQRRSKDPSPQQQERTEHMQASPTLQKSANETSLPDSSASAMAKRRARRLVTKSRFQGFDDFDVSQATRPASESPEPTPKEPSQALSVENMDVDEPAEAEPSQSRPHKRPLSEEGEQDMYESMLTGVAAMKRRKFEAVTNKENNAFAKTGETSARDSAEPATVKKKKVKEIDVVAEMHKRREAEEEERRKDEETLREGLNGIDIRELKNLAQIEEMEIPTRQRPDRNSNTNGHSDRWDPAWNGRRNFKKFRPQGQRRDGPRLQTVIVTLEEVPRKGHGLGDEYWLTSSSKSSKTKSQATSQSQTLRNQSAVSQPAEEHAADPARFRRRLEFSRAQDADEAVAEDLQPEEVAGTARDDQLVRQTRVVESQRRPGGTKRQAGGEVAGPAAKRAKAGGTAASRREVVAIDEDDDDDGDDLKFRRRRR